MVFEVVRVYQFICFRVEDESVLNVFSNICDFGVIGYMFFQFCSLQNVYFYKCDFVYFFCELYGND